MQAYFSYFRYEKEIKFSEVVPNHVCTLYVTFKLSLYRDQKLDYFCCDKRATLRYIDLTSMCTLGYTTMGNGSQ